MRKGFHDPKNTTIYVCDTYIYNSHLYPHICPLKSEKKTSFQNCKQIYGKERDLIRKKACRHKSKKKADNSVTFITRSYGDHALI